MRGSRQRQVTEGDLFLGVTQTFRLCAIRRAASVSFALAPLLTVWLTGCAVVAPKAASPEDASPQVPLTTVAEPTPSVAAMAATPRSAPPTLQPAPTRIDPSAPVTLTMWLPPEMAIPGEGNPGRQALSDQMAAFLAANPRARVEVIPKAAYGPGGIVSMVLATKPVVPERLPDLIVFDTSELHRLADADVLQPLDDMLPASFWTELYPFAAEVVTVGDQHLAAPYQADIDLLVYNREAVPEPPRSWDQLLPGVDEGSQGPAYIFPAAGSDGAAADAFLVHYVALGGRLTDENARPYLDSGITAKVLRSYRAAVDGGAVPDAVRRLRTREDCWNAYLAGEADLANATARFYQRDMAQLEGSGYAPLITVGGGPAVMARSWAWAVVTDDPGRKELAARYLATAMEPERLGAWCAATWCLPTHPAVLPLVIEDAPFRRFVDEQLTAARPQPNLADYSSIQSAVARAIEDVLDGVATPERAAVVAASAVVRLR